MDGCFRKRGRAGSGFGWGRRARDGSEQACMHAWEVGRERAREVSMRYAAMSFFKSSEVLFSSMIVVVIIIIIITIS